MKWTKLGLVIVAAAIAGALITIAIVHPSAKDADDEAPKAPQRVTIENGEPTVNLDLPAQQKIGLVTAPVSSTERAASVDIYGSVADVQELAAIANQIASARAQLEQANAKAQYDRTELTRLRALNADNKNVSDRAVQEAEAAVAADNASAGSANAAIQAAISSATQKFGPAIAQAVGSHSQLYRDLVSIREVLIAFAMPPSVAAPQTLRITSPASVDAHLLSIAPRVDPRLQRPAYFYLAPATSLSAGMNVTAQYAAAGGVRTAVVPPEAIVSWQGKSWIYVRRDATHFVRRDVSNASAGDQVVTSGAQQLLSEEMRAQLHESD